jgi:hypothetical protein
MPVLRLTSKLLGEIDDPPSSDSTSSPLGDWYGHIFTIERRKCIMFINEPTLFVCPALGVVKSEYRWIVPFFKEALTRALRIMQFSRSEVDWILAHHSELAIGRATNRSTMGSLNNRITDTKTLIPWLGGLETCDIGEVTRSLNETPMKPIGYSNGLERMRSVVAQGMK